MPKRQEVAKMEKMKNRIDCDKIDPMFLRMWRMPGWSIEKFKPHPFGRFYLNVGMNVEAYVELTQYGDVVKLYIWPYHK